MTPLIKLLIAIIIIYFLVTAFMKLTKWTLKAVIIVLIIAIFVFGYTSVSEMFSTSPSEKIKERFNDTENQISLPNEENITEPNKENITEPNKENITEAQELILELPEEDNLTQELNETETLLDELDLELNESELL